RHLYVINQSGLLYDQILDASYDKLGVSNHGETYLYNYEGFSGNEPPLIVDTRHRFIPMPPDQRAYNSIQMTSYGSILWGVAMNRGIGMTSPGRAAMFLPNAAPISWFASEEMFTFTYMDGRPHSGEIYLADPGTQVTARFPQNTSARVFSPDGAQK